MTPTLPLSYETEENLLLVIKIDVGVTFKLQIRLAVFAGIQIGRGGEAAGAESECG